MSEALERWQQVTAGFTQRLEAVADGQWDSATPCSEFSVRQLVEHTLDVQRMLPKMLGATGAIDTPIGNDPVNAWKLVVGAALAAYQEEGALATTVQSPVGPMPAELFMGALAVGDALIHTWDLARSIGADETLPDNICQIQLQGLQQIPAEFLRQPGRFDNAIEPPAGANAQTQLLCFAGRQL